MLFTEVLGALTLKSNRLPVDGTQGREATWEALGFTLGDPLSHDPIFREATFPEGWGLRNDERDPRHLTIHDEKDRARGHIFYKNASYDRKANVYLKRRFSITDANLVEHREQNGDHFNYSMVITDSTVTYPTYRVVGNLTFEPEGEHPPKGSSYNYDYKNQAHDKALQWLDEHYPNWKDPTAYWDEDVAGVEYARDL